MSKKRELIKDVDITEDQVREYLEAHPDFMPEFLNNISAPIRDLGDGVVDFQHHLLKNLQNNSKSLGQRYDLLVDYCRENLSAQVQVHSAVLKVMQARSIEQLLELLSVDMLSVFNLDVVRIAMESDVPFDASYGEKNYSGIVFVSAGTVDALFSNGGSQRNVLLVGDAQINQPIGFEQIFVNCDEQVQSCALLRLNSEMVDKHVILALGVRHKERYHTGQGTELLHFFAQTVALQLDKYLDDLTL
ncbi:MAG: DUF484 family protein [Rickettsiales bacterium]